MMKDVPGLSVAGGQTHTLNDVLRKMAQNGTTS